MTTSTKTQCPHCYKAFNLPDAQLNQVNAKGRCGFCQQVFLVNDHLIVSANPEQVKNKKPIIIDKISSDEKASQSSAQPESRYTQKLVKKETPLDNNLSDDNLLFHDDMAFDGQPEAIAEYGSLDEMEAWLKQLEPSKINHNPEFINDNSAESPQASVKDPSTSKADTYAGWLTPSSTFRSHDTSKTTVNPNIANDINENIEPTNIQYNNENAWLATLLEEKKISDAAMYGSDDTDLSALLTDMGIASDDQDKINKERNDKIQARMQDTSTRSENRIAAILWSAGCLLLLLLLLAQYVIFNLNTLMKNPNYAARLQAICSIAACSLPHADIQAFSISTPTYQASRIKTASVFSDIGAELSNQNKEAQLLPNIKVSVYNKSGLIGEFIALPNDYLLSPQTQLAASSNKSILFTVPINANQISQVTVDALY